MNFWDIFVLFMTFFSTAIVGFLSSRKSRNSAKEFLSAQNNLNRWQTALSVTATDFGGSALVGTIGLCYSVGVSGMWWMLAGVPGFLFLGFFLAERLHYSGFSTVPDFLGNRYTPSCKMLSSIMHIFSNLALLSAQFTISSALLQTIAGVEPALSLIIAMLLVMLLTSGGLRSVINTDVTLFIIIIISVLMAVPVILHEVGGLESIFTKVPSGFLRLDRLGFSEPLSWVLMCLLSYSTNQNFVQRLVSAKDRKAARFSSFFPACFYVFIAGILAVIGLTAKLLLPEIADTNMVFASLIIQYFPHGVIGFAIAGVFAATISTATSSIHGLTVLFINDVYKNFRKNTADQEILMISRIAVFVFGGISICLSLYSTNIIKVLYVSGLFYSTSVFFPLIFGIRSKYIEPKAAFISILLSVLASLSWELFVYNKYDFISKIPSNVVGLAVSLATLLMFSNYLKRNTA